MSIRFNGDLPLWAGLLVGLLISSIAWVYYYRDTRHLTNRLSWLLPSLRALAIFLVVIILAGPVLHHRQVIGQLGRVLVFLDGSQSMGVPDPNMALRRKLLLSESFGWIPRDTVDISLMIMHDRLVAVREQAIAEMQQDAADQSAKMQCFRTFAEGVQGVADRMDQYRWDDLPTPEGSKADWRGIAARFQSEIVASADTLLAQSSAESHAGQTRPEETRARQLLALCRSMESFERSLSAAFELYCSEVAGHEGKRVTTALELLDETPRWQRAERLLLDDTSGLLRQLASTHDIELYRLAGTKAEGIWDSGAAGDMPHHFGSTPSAPTTDLGSGIRRTLTLLQRQSASSEKEPGSAQRTAVLLLSDGQHNSGPSPIQVARVLGSQRIPVYTVGLGARREPPDLALLDITHPDMVFQKGRIHGTLVLKDEMPPGREFLVQIEHDGQVVWQRQLKTMTSRQRRIGFEFPVDDIVKQTVSRQEDRLEHHAIPITLQASILPVDGEADVTNNSREMRFAAITQTHKLLLLDSWSRWETRYIRNCFQRDQQWQVDTILVGQTTTRDSLPRGEGRDTFPTKRSALMDYDLIVFGEVPADVLSDQEQLWIRDFVGQRGGGIVFIDGRNGLLAQLDPKTIGAMLPVSRLDGHIETKPERLQLTRQGISQGWLMLQPTSQANQRFWTELPPPSQIEPVRALPGTEVLAEAVVNGKPVPAIIARSFGAGHVLYFAFDETWRWRYKAADTYHQRFWNQVAKWVMPRPFAVSDAYVALDSGPPSYTEGDTAEIRVQLHGADGQVVNDSTVDALLWREGQIVSTVHLESDGTSSGTYHGRTGQLVQGEYAVSVRAAGFSKQALTARTQFCVLARPNNELKQLSSNTPLLDELAHVSGGRSLGEEQIGQLVELLKPLSSGRIVETDTLLWQSYWWFSMIIGLLTIEWILRKRAGLL